MRATGKVKDGAYTDCLHRFRFSGPDQDVGDSEGSTENAAQHHGQVRLWAMHDKSKGSLECL